MTLKVKAVRSFEPFGTTCPTTHHIPQDSNLKKCYFVFSKVRWMQRIVMMMTMMTAVMCLA